MQVMIKLAILLTRRKGMTHQEFVNYRRDIHVPLLLSIPETKQYVRKFVVSVPVPATGYPNPAYDTMIETWFDSVDDMNAFFLSDNFKKKVDPDHSNFLDIPAAVWLVTEETVVI
ncbi:EthD domain-containing protein [Cytophagaceae bacterium DM2B3-1]|uniref:EthD domain-containing protein n=1 Tax=Xanthocytophaga flava TaxID=3048013 RepID=A0ABT7CYC2_9BACT|nr:EthD domain-containing protein [Xanthocytophaga flavus]MDJ1469296.1 EthD domain-containing protein [Xanthocytophaga flavus]MDJ1498752.1 EthD domain-containing protein [Xanthocytophaga flavus]